jgi:hypothetical protein
VGHDLLRRNRSIDFAAARGDAAGTVYRLVALEINTPIVHRFTLRDGSNWSASGSEADIDMRRSQNRICERASSTCYKSLLPSLTDFRGFGGEKPAFLKNANLKQLEFDSPGAWKEYASIN